MTDFADLAMRVDTSGLKKGEQAQDSFARKAEQTEGKTNKATAAISSGFRKMIPVIGAAIAALGAGAGFAASIREAEKFETTMFRVEAVIKATGGAAGRSADQLRQQARELARGTLESTEGVLRAQQTLLTFRKVQGDVFDRAIVAAADMTAALGGDLNSATLQLAKALENPLEGISALSRSGTVFTAAQKDMVRAMVEAGQTAEAQAFILDELEAQYKGTAEAAAGGLAGAQDTLGQAMQELRLELADSLGLLGLATAANNAAAGAVNWLAENIDDARGYIIAAAVGLTAFYTPAIIAASFQTGVFIAGLITLRGALIATGIGAFVVGAGMLVNQLLKLAESVGGVGNAFSLMKDVAVEAFGRIPLVFDGVLSKARGFGLGIAAASADMAANALEAIISIPQKAVEVFDWAVGAIATLFSNLPSLIGDAIVSAINFVIGKVEALVQKSIDLFNGLIEGLNAIPGVAISTLGDAGIGRVVNEIGAGIAQIADFDASQGVAGLRATADGLRDSADGAALAGDALLALGTSPLNSIEAMRQAAADAAAAIADADDPESIVNALRDVGDAANKLGGAAGGALQEIKPVIEDATDAVQDMGQSVRSDLTRAWQDFIDNGLKDFDGFARSILKTFGRMLAQMILLGKNNPIQISASMGASGIMSALGGAQGGLAGMANTALAGVGGMSGLGSAVMGGASFLGSGIASGFAAGGIGGAVSGGASAFATAMSGATMGLGGAAAALGAAIPVIGAVALVVGAFRTKTKELDNGLNVAIDGLDVTAETFRKIEKSRFFGLSKSTSTSTTADPDNPIIGAVNQVQGSIMEAARVLGVGASAFEDFSHEFRVSLKGLSDDEKIAAINAELGKMGDGFAQLVPGMESANQVLERAAQISAAVRGMISTPGFRTLEDQIFAASQQGNLRQQSQSLDAAPTRRDEEKTQSILQRLIEEVRNGNMNSAFLQSKLVALQQRAELAPT